MKIYKILMGLKIPQTINVLRVFFKIFLKDADRAKNKQYLCNLNAFAL
jgi:hypothetical protein